MAANSSRAAERVFPALLKYWRGRRGLSQLDLGLAADVSARHISFLETGRSGPSQEMILLLADVLDVPLRDRNELLRAAGFELHYDEPDLVETLTGPLLAALELMFGTHEPFPMMVIDRRYKILMANHAGMTLAATLVPDLPQDLNLARVLFDPSRGRDLVVNWDDVAGTLLRRLQRELLDAPSDEELRSLVEDLQGHPDLGTGSKVPDMGQASEPVIPVLLRLPDGRELGFITMVTTFNAPQNVTLDELKIESYYPADDATRTICHELFAS